MTTTQEDQLAKKAMIPKLFKGYPSWAGKVTIGLINEYLEYVEDVSAEAVDRAIKAFRAGGMARDNAFPLTGPELAAEARKAQTNIDMETYWDRNDFIEIDTPEWKAICKGTEVRSMPSIEYKGPRLDLRGKIGWYVSKEITTRHADLIAECRREALENRVPLTTPRLQKMTDKPRTA